MWLPQRILANEGNEEDRKMGLNEKEECVDEDVTVGNSCLGAIKLFIH